MWELYMKVKGALRTPQYRWVNVEISKKDGDKIEALSKAQVAIANGKVFYADPESRTDITAAISIANRENLTENPWKLAQEINGTKWNMVTIAEMEEAERLALEFKGSVVS